MTAIAAILVFSSLWLYWFTRNTSLAESSFFTALNQCLNDLSKFRGCFPKKADVELGFNQLGCISIHRLTSWVIDGRRERWAVVWMRVIPLILREVHSNTRSWQALHGMLLEHTMPKCSQDCQAILLAGTAFTSSP